MKISCLPFFLFLFVNLSLQAQTDFRSGYIIETNGDTLFGKVDYRGGNLMSQRCRFLPAGSGAMQTFYPGEIHGYRFTDSKFFVSKEVDEKSVFVEFLIKGELNIYYLKENSEERYFLSKEDDPLIEIPYEEAERVKDGRIHAYQSTLHTVILKHYTQDAPNLSAQIMRISKPHHKNLMRLAEIYHEQVCEDGVCIIYEKKPPAVKFKLELAARYVQYSPKFENLNRQNYIQWSSFVHIGVPGISEKIFFRTGLSIFSLDHIYWQVGQVGLVRHYVVPLHAEYLYPRGRVRPRFAVGANLWITPITTSLSGVSRTLSFESVSTEGGVNVEVLDKLFLTATAELELFPTFLLNFSFKRRMSTAGRLGLLIEL